MFGKTSEETFDFVKESLKEFLKESVDDCSKEFSYGFLTKSMEEMLREPIKASHENFSEKFMEKNPLTKMPNQILAEIMEQSVEEVLKNFEMKTVELSRSGFQVDFLNPPWSNIVAIQGLFYFIFQATQLICGVISEKLWRIFKRSQWNNS